MKVFQKLLDTVKAQCPTVITEEVYGQMMDEFDAGIADIQADAEKAGQAAGFQEGYSEGKRVAAEKAKLEMDALIQKLDDEAVEKLNAIIQALDENHTQKLEEVYTYLTSNMVPKTEYDKAVADYNAAVADKDIALADMDAEYAADLERVYEAVCEDHAKKMQQVYEAVCENHAKKLEILMEQVDENHAKKLMMVKEACDKKCKDELQEQEEALAKEAAKEVVECKKAIEAECKKAIEAEQANKIETIAESVEKYLNYALEEYRPKAQLISEAKYNAAIKSLETIKDVLKVQSIIEESKEGIFSDYENQLKSKDEKINTLINEKVELAAKLKKQEATVLLESICAKCSPGESRFLKSYFKNTTDPQIITESIEDAKASYRRLHAEKRETLQKDIKRTVAAVPSNIVTESKKEQVKEKPIVSEEKQTKPVQKSVEPTKTHVTLADFYAEYLKK